MTILDRILVWVLLKFIAVSGGIPFIQTFTGKEFHFLRPTADMVDIRDVAHSLALKCRFNGHCKRFYSVAEHCCILSDYVINVLKLGPREALHILMHDAAETYTPDMPSPMKHVLWCFQRLERIIEFVVMPALGVPVLLPAHLKKLDHDIIVDEKQELMNTSVSMWEGYEDTQPLGISFPEWGPEEAEAEFMKRYEKLTRMIDTEERYG